MAKNRYESLILIQQIYDHVGWTEFTKHDLPVGLRNHLAALSTAGYIKRLRKIPDIQHHYIPVYRIASKYVTACAPPLSSIEANNTITNEPDTI